MLKSVALLLLAILLAALPAAAAPLKARSLSGSGLLLLPVENGPGSSPLVLYREPGLGRIAELAAAQLLQIAPSPLLPDGLRAVIVTDKNLGWYRVVYDDGEREGWLEGRPTYQYQRWADLLPGRGVMYPAGLRKDYYLLRSEPAPEATPLETVNRESFLTVLKVVNDWINVRRGDEVSGWLRWRDDNGRLLISVIY